MPVKNLSIFEFDCFKEPPAESHDISALKLIAEAIRVDNCAAFESRSHAQHLNVARCPIHCDLREGRDIAALLKAAAHPESAAGCFSLTPSELLRPCFKNCPQPFVG